MQNQNEAVSPNLCCDAALSEASPPSSTLAGLAKRSRFARIWFDRPLRPRDVALAAAFGLAAFGAAPLFADGGAGGNDNGGAGGDANGGGGGGGTGTIGANDNGQPGTGGTGGAGGSSYTGIPGGAGGSVGTTTFSGVSVNGGSGGDGAIDPGESYGSGGGGGGGDAVHTSQTAIGIAGGVSLSGGNGGHGGEPNRIAGGGGAGGGGLTTISDGTTVNNAGTIAGGMGGDGGGLGGQGYFGGGGGAGGDGLRLLGNGSGISNGGTISGGSAGAGGDADFAGDGGDGGVGINVFGENAFISNVGTVAGGDGGNGGNGSSDKGAGGDGGSGIHVRNSATGVFNFGTVTGGAGGVAVSGGEAGAGGFGVVMSSGDLTNAAGSLITGGNGAEAPTGNGGIGGQGVSLTTGNLTNAGEIVGGSGGGGAFAGGMAGSGVLLNDGDLTNQSSGTIHGGRGGDSGIASANSGGTGVSLDNGNLMNAGTITGGSGGDTSGGNQGPGLSDGGAGGNGVSLSGGDLTNTGTITGGTGGDSLGPSNVQSNGGSGGIGVVASGGTLDNSGTISGGASGTAEGAGSSVVVPGVTAIAGNNLQIINSGTISAGLSSDGSTGENAIFFNGGSNRLELQAGSLINGNVLATLSGDDTFVLGGSTNSDFDVSSIGGSAQYRDFEAFEKTGTSTWTLTGTGAQDWRIQSGTLIGDTNSFGGDLTFANGIGERSVIFNQTTDGTYTGAISGDGNAFKQGDGVLTLTGTTSTDWQIDAGTLVGNTGSIQGNVLNNASLVFDQTADGTYAGTVSGSGTAFKQGTAVLTLTGTTSTDWQIDDGTLVGDTGSIQGNVLNDASLIFNQSTNGTYAGTVSGTGLTFKQGAGTLALTGLSSTDWQVDQGTVVTAAERFTANVTINPDGTFAFDQAADATYAGRLAGTGQFLKAGPSTLHLTGDSPFGGTTTIAAGTLAVNGTLGGTVNVTPAGTLGGVGTIVGDVMNAGVVAPGNSIGTLLIDGNYAGNGGRLDIEAALGNDGFPADRLLVSGDATGTTTVFVQNQGGAGAATGTTSTDGASIIQVGGDSSAGAFRLAGEYVAVGPYQYRLSAFAPGDSAAGQLDPRLAATGATSFWDYRLQSVSDAAGNPVAVPQIAAYQALGPGALQYNWAVMDNLHNRLGEIQHVTDVRDGNIAEGIESFFRVRGWNGQFDGDHGPDFEQDLWFMQTGVNLVGLDMRDTGDSLRLGLAFDYGRSHIAVPQPGSIEAELEFETPALALTGTYQAVGGWYVDTVLRGAYYDTTAATSARGHVADFDGAGLGASVETGYPVLLGDRLIFEPQLQVSYQRNWFENFTDVDGVTADLHDNNGLRGRLGGRLQKTFVGREADRLWSPYLTADVMQGFLNDGSVAASGVDFVTDTGSTNLMFGGGLNAQLGPRWGLYSNVAYLHGLADGGIDYAWTGTGGLRLNF